MQKFIIIFAALAIFSMMFVAAVVADQRRLSGFGGVVDQFLKVSPYLDEHRGMMKRNHGLIDTIINLPDLDKIGKK